MQTSAPIPRWSGYLTAVSVLLVGLSALIVAGCDRRDNTSVPADSDKATAGPAGSAAEVLKQMAAAYEKAKSYEDSGELRINEVTSDG